MFAFGTHAVLFILSCLGVSAYSKVELHAKSQFSLLANHTELTAMYTELESVENQILFQHQAVKKNKLVYVLLAMIPFLNVCGCDRCFMGYIMVGIIKGVGSICGPVINNACMAQGCPLCCFLPFVFAVWAIIDFCVAAHAALTMSPRLEMVGYHVEFLPQSVEPAWYGGLVLLALPFIPTILYCLIVCSAYYVLGSIGKFSPSTRGIEKAEHQQFQQPSTRTPKVIVQEHASVVHRMSSNLRDTVVVAMPMSLTKVLRQAHQLHKEASPAEIKMLFERYDENKDGTLDSEEFKTALAKIGVDEAQATDLFNQADKNSDGLLSLKEFIDSLTAPDLKDLGEKDPEEGDMCK